MLTSLAREHLRAREIGGRDETACLVGVAAQELSNRLHALL